MDRELLNLLELIEQSDYVTAVQLAQHIQKSEKTTRARALRRSGRILQKVAPSLSPSHATDTASRLTTLSATMPGDSVAYNALPATRLKPPKSVLCIS